VDWYQEADGSNWDGATDRGAGEDQQAPVSAGRGGKPPDDLDQFQPSRWPRSVSTLQMT